MAVRKIAISLPDEVLSRVDVLAKKAKTTRSGYITRILEQVSRASSQAEITDRINRVFSSIDVVEEQSETARVLWTAAERDWEW